MEVFGVFVKWNGCNFIFEGVVLEIENEEVLKLVVLEFIDVSEDYFFKVFGILLMVFRNFVI